MPLDVYVACRVRALAEGGRIFGACVFRDFAHYAQMRFVAGILDKDSPPTRRHDNRLVHETDVAGAHEMVFPSHAIASELHPVRTAPAVALELYDFLDEIPSPRHLTLWRHRVNSCPKRCEIDATIPYCRGGKNRLGAIDCIHQCPTLAIEHVVISCHRADVQIITNYRGSRHIVAISRTALGREPPFNFEALRVDGKHDARSINHKYPATTHHRRGIDAIRQWYSRRQAQRSGQCLGRRIARPFCVSLQLAPLSRIQDNPVDCHATDPKARCEQDGKPRGYSVER